MTATYNYWLVAVSLCVAVLASYTGFDLAARIRASVGGAAIAWLVGGACSLGSGIWAMHFIGMLAFSLPIPLTYDAPLTVLSLVIAVTVSGLALFVVSRETLSRLDIAAGGFLMGLGISAMHYAGMGALQTLPAVTYDPLLLATSVAIAIGAAFAAVWIAFALRRASDWLKLARLGSAVVMGVAITGMHYTGMAAAHFHPDTVCLTGSIVSNAWLAAAVAGATLVILAVTLGLSVLDSRMASQTAKLAASLQRANEELQRLALHDSLTGLPNRLLLEDRIEQAIAQARRASRQCAVVYLDLDRFKTVNDSLGHLVGDELLRAIAARLQGEVRDEDTISRLGGDEFAMLLRDISDVEDAASVAAKILETVREPFPVHDHELYVTPSVGISVFPLHGDSAQMLITRADAAMYSAKQAGRDTFRVFTSQMSTFFPERLLLENDLRRAISRNEFELNYQPKIGVQEGGVLGTEALIRWRHPEKGLLLPQDFIPLAEETGLIIPIGNWVIETACTQNKAWQDAGLPHMRVAVNISGLQFRQRDLLATISRALEKSGLAPSCLEIEITESIVMQNASDAIVTLEKLSDMGIHVSIDDFGTGYSSLGYLKRFRIDRLKIDRSFIRDISSDANDAAIVRATIGLAHNLRLKVVAEGVETADQLEILQSLGCDEYQGYYESRPVDAVDFERYLREEIGNATDLVATS